MATKGKKTKHTKLHGAALAAWRKKHKPHAKKTPRTAHRKAHGSTAHHGKAAHHHRCGVCGHAAKHVARQGCLHFDGHRFCSCKSRG